ncbi:adenine deaminase [Flavipsychrobacter stenotrophus]|uniref:Adenine deaminase n=1 Tax=Flavipsychrobacter stenotrophus TaxID=2077091 RepID=A0A2S7SSY4_9BACT|nr:adenine deaminase [Flavipsychrobacter stenotrophus]PQJ09808.1 adenine deaminase [Flavipsychrobacter stenotrophus]
MHSFSISGQLIDLFQRRTYPAQIDVQGGIIYSIKEVESAPEQYILPGFVDAHIHIESSMLVPVSFAQVAVLHGTVATVSDPHEIANVCGMEGVQYMIDNSKLSPFKFFFGAPSCVPATGFETAGATLDEHDVAKLLQSDDIWYLSEMMNYPGVLYKDPGVMAKIKAAQKVGKPVDGHAPGLRGEVAMEYARAGITTDHECFTLGEALDKVFAEMHILIREGSAAKNYEALHKLLKLHPARVMFCSDDKHPDELVLHHINDVVKRSLAHGYDLYDVLLAACANPVWHYNLPVGLLRVNEPADFIVIDNPQDFNILKTYISGELVAENGKSLLPYMRAEPINNFKAMPKTVDEFVVKASSAAPTIRVIEAVEGQLVTNELQFPAKVVDGNIVSDTDNDVLKLALVNRYEPHAKVSVAFIKNFGLTYGAIASTVGHDCHNIIAVGVDDASLCEAVNALIASQGGISVVSAPGDVSVMPLPVAGLMSLDDAYTVAAAYTHVDKKAKELGTKMHAPFMTLSFMALLVIPALKLSDKGLFDGGKFEFTSVEI